MPWWVTAYVLVAACLFATLLRQSMPWERQDALDVVFLALLCLVWPLFVAGVMIDLVLDRIG